MRNKRKTKKREGKGEEKDTVSERKSMRNKRKTKAKERESKGRCD